MKPASRIHLLAGACVLSLAAASPAASQAAPSTPSTPVRLPASGAVVRSPAREQELLQQTKAADGFNVTIFAGPPVVSYPVCLTTANDGAVFVGSDPNLSLSQLKGVGRVIRLVDTDGDGHADRYTTFAEMDSPRGIFYDGRTLYVMHPPNLTAYRDTNGDGIADESEDLV